MKGRTRDSAVADAHLELLRDSSEDGSDFSPSFLPAPPALTPPKHHPQLKQAIAAAMASPVKPTKDLGDVAKAKESNARHKALARRESKLRKRTRLVESKGGRCFYCRRPIRAYFAAHRYPDGATIEHLVPVAVGGKSHKINYVYACPRCNFLRGSCYEIGYTIRRAASLVCMVLKARLEVWRRGGKAKLSR